MRFLFTRRWILFAVAVVLMAYAAVRLGEWQFHRLDDRKASNAIIRHNLAGEPVPVSTVLAPGRPVSAQHEWKQITATGRWVPEKTVVVRYQTRDGKSGVDVVTPLLTRSGAALLVNRGWMATGNVGTTDPDVPAPPTGTVTIKGWVRANAEGDATAVEHGSTRAVSSEVIAGTMPFPVYGGFVELESSDPAPTHPLAKAERPDLSNGPHFFYGLQWWFFGLLAVFGFCYLAWDERRKARQSARTMPPSTGSMTPEMNEAAGESRKAAARPNSSGRP